MSEQTIVCPNCGKRIPISKALTGQIEADLRKSFEAAAERREEEIQAIFERKLVAETARVQKQAQKAAEQATSLQLSKMEKELAEARKREKIAQASFERRLVVEKSRLERQARKAVEAEIPEKIAELQDELREKEKLVAEVRRQQSEIQRRQAQLAAREKSIETEIARRTERALQKTREEIEEEYRSHELELEKKLSDAKRQAAELKRKLEQSSQQAQGEVIELELEKVLRKNFPEDVIEAIAKGKTGADVLQKVYTSDEQYCGAIIWESKNTRNWSNGWLGKLRNDQRRQKAELAVLVSMALPKDVSHFAQVDGVWVTEFPLAMCVASALRTNLVQVAMLKQSSKGKQEKMELLYEYLSSLEFRQRVEAIVEAFRSMQEDLQRERQTMEKQWAKREKHIQLVVENVSGMYGDMQAIAGQSLPKIRRLELPAIIDHKSSR